MVNIRCKLVTQSLRVTGFQVVGPDVSCPAGAGGVMRRSQGLLAVSKVMLDWASYLW